MDGRTSIHRKTNYFPECYFFLNIDRVGQNNIWSPADFVHSLTNKEIIIL